jgi:hypothetical protein
VGCDEGGVVAAPGVAAPGEVVTAPGADVVAPPVGALGVAVLAVGDVPIAFRLASSSFVSAELHAARNRDANKR